MGQCKACTLVPKVVPLYSGIHLKYIFIKWAFIIKEVTDDPSVKVLVVSPIEISVR